MRQLTEVCPVCRRDQEFIFEYQRHYCYRCPSCGTVSTYPLPDSATIEAHYARKFKEGNYLLIREYSEQYN